MCNFANRFGECKFLTIKALIMDKKSKNPQDVKDSKKKIRVAILCICAIVVFYIGCNFLKGINVFHKKTYYYCLMDNATGVQQNTQVWLSGYKVGMVQSVEMLSANPPRICAHILFNENFDLPDDSRLEVMANGLLGGNVLNIVMGTSKSTFSDGDTIPCSVKPGMLDGIADMKDQIASVVASVDTIGMELKDILHKDGGGENLKATLENIEAATHNLNDILADNKGKVNSLVTSLDRFGKTLDEASPQLTQILDNFDKISDTLAKAEIAEVIANANQTIVEVKEMVAKVNRGEGTIGNLMSEETVVNKVEETIQSLKDLVVDIKANPKRYINVTVFGKKEKTDKEKKNQGK